jgi:hypothetical protein
VSSPVYAPDTAVEIGGRLQPPGRCLRASEAAFHAAAPPKFVAAVFRRIGHCTAAALSIALTLALKVPKFLLRRATRAYLHRLRCERRAMKPGARREPDALDSIYDATLDRLGRSPRPSVWWWREVMAAAEADHVLPYQRPHAYDRYRGPHFLRIESVREWLGDPQVRAGLKALATERILASKIDTAAVRARLAQSYACYTFEHPAFAELRIDTAVDGLVAGALSSLAPSERLMLSLMRESTMHCRRICADVLAALSRIESLMAARRPETEYSNRFDATESMAGAGSAPSDAGRVACRQAS